MFLKIWKAKTQEHWKAATREQWISYPMTEKGDDCYVELFISRQGNANTHVRYDCAPRGVVRRC
jgi:hypothetical protein